MGDRSRPIHFRRGEPALRFFRNPNRSRVGGAKSVTGVSAHAEESRNSFSESLHNEEAQRQMQRWKFVEGVDGANAASSFDLVLREVAGVEIEFPGPVKSE